VAISGATIHSVSHEYIGAPWDLRAVHLIDGSGLSGNPPVHELMSSATNNSWQTGTSSGTANVQFDLGALYDLDSLHVWNLNFASPYNGRGAHTVNIYTSQNGTTWNFEETRLFPQASGASGDAGFHINAQPWQSARYVQFDILNNHGGFDNAGHVGMSEVQFFQVPEPGSISLAWFALAATSLRRRRGGQRA
jgi:hypothetical protein